MVENWRNEYFLARGMVIHRQSGDMLHFFSALHNVLNQNTMNTLIQSLCNILHSDFKVSSYMSLITKVNLHSAGILWSL